MLLKWKIIIITSSTVFSNYINKRDLTWLTYFHTKVHLYVKQHNSGNVKFLHKARLVTLVNPCDYVTKILRKLTTIKITHNRKLKYEYLFALWLISFIQTILTLFALVMLSWEANSYFLTHTYTTAMLEYNCKTKKKQKPKLK